MKTVKKVVSMFLVMAMVMAMVGCGSAKKEDGEAKKKEPIKVATKLTAEQYILGEMLTMLIEENTDYTVELTKAINGGTTTIHPAMEKGEYDLYPEYTSGGWIAILGHSAKGISDEEMFSSLKKEYEEKYKMTWLGLYGFNNTFAIVCPKEIAEKYNLKTISDLAKVSDQLTFGASPDYLEREDAFPALAQDYNLNFKNVSDLDISLRYEALESKDIDVTVAFTTDAQLSVGDVVVLEDDLKSIERYLCSTVVRQETLEKYPGLEDVLMKMDGVLSDEEMSKLNYEVEVNGKDEKDVAHEFLISKGLIEK